MKDKDPDIVFSWCWFFSVVVGTFLSSALILYFFPVSTGIKSDLQAGLCHLLLLTTFVSLMVYVSDKVVPRRN